MFNFRNCLMRCKLHCDTVKIYCVVYIHERFNIRPLKLLMNSVTQCIFYSYNICIYFDDALSQSHLTQSLSQLWWLFVKFQNVMYNVVCKFILVKLMIFLHIINLRGQCIDDFRTTTTSLLNVFIYHRRHTCTLKIYLMHFCNFQLLWLTIVMLLGRF